MIMMQMRRLARLSAFVVAMVLGFGIANARDVTFDERVQAQRAIENVYWSHRIWPKENGAPKPALSEIMSDAAIRERVRDYLEKSSALDDVWHRPISGEQLHAELERMARSTRDGATLRELFDALRDDPTLIAETLARQALASRLVRELYAADGRFHGALRKKAQAVLDACKTIDCTSSPGEDYRQTTWTRRKEGTKVADAENEPGRLALDAAEWKAQVERLRRTFGGATGDVPVRSWSGLEETPEFFFATAVLAQSDDEITIATRVWAKVPFETWWQSFRKRVDTAAAYDAETFSLPAVAVSGCTPDTWRPSVIPVPRSGHAAVWTGTEMIVWGGFQNGYPVHDSGRRYNPATDSWAAVSSGLGAPQDRQYPSAVWTGMEMIVWGGMIYHADTNGTSSTNTGARYNPSTDSWVSTSTGTNVPSNRMRNFAAWTGTELIVWGGMDRHSGAADSWTNTGGRYDPSSDTWTATSTGVGVPTPRAFPAAAWTGEEMVIWAGQQPIAPYSYLSTGSRYSTSTNTWVAMAGGAANAPSGRSSSSAVWTGAELIVWGGFNDEGNLKTGGRFNPGTGNWSATSIGANVPAPRNGHTAIWTGLEMIIWGGGGTSGVGNSGARYNPSSDRWIPTSKGASAPTSRSLHTAIWTGGEMIVWGGAGDSTGGRYSPATDAWVPTSLGGIPPAGRDRHSAVWTGSEMIVWGGHINSGFMNSGGRYIPAIDTWFPTSTGSHVPTARLDHTAVWTGSEMIVWGGIAAGYSFPADGGRYNPTSDTWAATALDGAPEPRSHNEAVWTGKEMIVWGGFNSNDSQNTGGRYDPKTDSWRATSVSGEVPAPRYFAASVWTGKEMIVWGGLGLQQGELPQTGGRYDPSADGWKATAVSNDTPSGRYSHTAVWTGLEMIVWGGRDDKPDAVATGSRFDPYTNTWTRMATAPIGAGFHTAVWTGTEMIEWGGDTTGCYSGCLWTNYGSRYDPSLDRWTPTAGGNGLPAGRREHSAIWTGTEMVIWGGNQNSQTYLNTLGSYCVASCAVPIVYYQDWDGDGRGDPSMSFQACNQPSGYAGIAGDCADDDANTYSGAPEVKDGIDNQCPGDGEFGTIDEISGPTWWEGSTYRWTAQALATQYQLLRSSMASFSSGCVMFTSSVPSVDETSDPDPGAAYFYLVRSSAPGIAGGWGQRAAGNERSPDCLLPN